MAETTLSDLDELVLGVRDRICRSYVQEAVVAYQARAFRAAVVSTWIAVTYDIIGKIRELSNHGEPSAEAFVKDLDSAIKTRSVSRFQAIENDLLQKARDTFEFVGLLECEDLERLKTDRNRCAHPAFSADDVLFTPSPDLVRAHIVHAITHLLRHPPVQGKAALGRIKIDMLRLSFPQDQDEASKFLEEKYLNHSKVSLVESLVVVLLKVVIRGTDVDFVGHEEVVGRTLVAISRRHPAIYERKMSEQLPKLADGIDDQQLVNAFLLLGADRRVWDWIGAPTQQRMIEVARRHKFTPESGTVLAGLCVGELRDALLRAFRALPDGDQQIIISKSPRPELGDEAVRLYVCASGYRDAEARAERVIRPMVRSFSAEHVCAILKAVQDNSQIREAGGTPALMEELFFLTQRLHEATKSSWQEMMAYVIKMARDPDDFYTYPTLRKAMQERKMWPMI